MKKKFDVESCSFPQNEEELRRLLSPEQFEITKKNGTEMPFQNKYWNHKGEGIYVDVISKVPLFASIDKFDSGTGWPSFYKPIDTKQVKSLTDESHGMVRTEVRSTISNSHLGHVFPDAVKSKGGLRYCINSAALIFIPKEKMEEEGYGDYLDLFVVKN